jgi:GT2 family glycosyltransferase
MDVSILVVSYNTSELTRGTLRSVFDHTRDIDFEVIVIDNASSDGSVSDIRDEFPQVNLLALSGNIGLDGPTIGGWKLPAGVIYSC